MPRMVAVMIGTFGNMKKTRRVADESILAGGGANELPALQGLHRAGRRTGHAGGHNRGISVIFSIVMAPFSILSCLISSSTQPYSTARLNGVDGVWASGDLGLMSEMNHLMVNDSMRYAILL